MLGAAAEFLPARGDPKKPRSANTLGPLPGSVAGVGGRVTKRSFAIVRGFALSRAAPAAGRTTGPAVAIRRAVPMRSARGPRSMRGGVVSLRATAEPPRETVNGVARMRCGTVSWKVYAGKK